MNINVRIALALLLVPALAVGCAAKRNKLEAMVPSGAKNVEYTHESDSSDGVTFQLITEPKSYAYVAKARTELAKAGYALCGKSAISGWQPWIAEDRRAVPNKFWLVELYAKRDLGKFFVMRVVAVPAGAGSRWLQTIHLAVQAVPQGRQDTASINEFCG